jgi:hypothetical protein
MPLPRVRFTVRRLMVAVAIVALLYQPIARWCSVQPSPNSREERCGPPILDPIPGEHPSDGSIRMNSSPS